MTTPHETALRDLCNFFIAPTQYCEACDEFYLANPSAYVHRDYLLEHAAEFAPLLAAIAGGQYVSPGSGMVVVPAELLNIVRELRTTIAPTYDMSQEGRAYLARIDKAMLAAQRSPATSHHRRG